MGTNSTSTPVLLSRLPEQALSDTCLLERLSVDELMLLSQRAYTHYRTTGDSDERFAFELFRRAIKDKHERSWQALVELYTPLISSWIRKLEMGTWLVRQDREVVPVLVNTCFLKFFQVLQPAKFATFTSLSALIKYLRMCAHSAVFDEYQSLRAQRACEEKGWSTGRGTVVEDPAETFAALQAQQSLWQRVLSSLKSSPELVIIECVYLLDMKPPEIRHTYPDLFPTIRDVYLVKHNMLKRLRCNRHLRNELLSTLAP